MVDLKLLELVIVLKQVHLGRLSRLGLRRLGHRVDLQHGRTRRGPWSTTRIGAISRKELGCRGGSSERPAGIGRTSLVDSHADESCRSLLGVEEGIQEERTRGLLVIIRKVYTISIEVIGVVFETLRFLEKCFWQEQIQMNSKTPLKKLKSIRTLVEFK